MLKALQVGQEPRLIRREMIVGRVQIVCDFAQIRFIQVRFGRVVPSTNFMLQTAHVGDLFLRAPMNLFCMAGIAMKIIEHGAA